MCAAIFSSPSCAFHGRDDAFARAAQASSAACACQSMALWRQLLLFLPRTQQVTDPSFFRLSSPPPCDFVGSGGSDDFDDSGRSLPSASFPLSLLWTWTSPSSPISFSVYAQQAGIYTPVFLRPARLSLSETHQGTRDARCLPCAWLSNINTAAEPGRGTAARNCYAERNRETVALCTRTQKKIFFTRNVSFFV